MDPVLADAEALAAHAADWLAGVLQAEPGPVSVALSGGSTPKRLYELLAAPPFVDRVPWDRVHWFWGDERVVPPTDPRSNYRMAMEAMLYRVVPAAGTIHPVPTEGLAPDQAAARYQTTLQEFYGAPVLDPARPLFDVVLLGLGGDGHTASLFPGSTALAERTAWTAAAAGDPARVTLTYPALESCRHAAFLVAGSDKRDVLARIRAGDADLPAARYRPSGRLHWFADRAAAG